MTKEQLLIETLQHCLLHLSNDLYRDPLTRSDIANIKYTLNHALKKIDAYYKE